MFHIADSFAEGSEDGLPHPQDEHPVGAGIGRSELDRRSHSLDRVGDRLLPRRRREHRCQGHISELVLIRLAVGDDTLKDLVLRNVLSCCALGIYPGKQYHDRGCHAQGYAFHGSVLVLHADYITKLCDSFIAYTSLSLFS